MNPSYLYIQNRIKAFKSSYFSNRLISGLLNFLLFFSVLTPVCVSVEYYFYLDKEVKTVWFATYTVSLGFVFAAYVFLPIYRLLSIEEFMTDEEAAANIGNQLPTVSDKLINALQLSTQLEQSATQNDLLKAAIKQKSASFESTSFQNLITWKPVRKRALLLLILGIITATSWAVYPPFFTEGFKRFADFNTTYYPKPPFEFIYIQKAEAAFYNEPLTIKAKTTKPLEQSTMYLWLNGKRTTMQQSEDSTFYITISKVQEELHLRLEADGYIDDPQDIELIYRPTLDHFSIQLIFPTYLHKKPETIENTGNLLIPEGTSVEWNFKTSACDVLSIHFLPDSSKQLTSKALSTQSFQFKKTFFKTTIYELQLSNTSGINKDPIQYTIQVVEDQYPVLQLEQYKDTNLYDFILIAGAITDDYGFTDLKLTYYTDLKSEKKQVVIPIRNTQNSQQFYYKWDLSYLQLAKGEKLVYTVSVRDNDGIHGPKETKSSIMQFEYPSEKQVEQVLEKSIQQAENQISNSAIQAEKLKNEVKKLEQKLKSKKQFDYQDKKALEELIEKHKEMQNQMDELQSKYQDLKEKKTKFEQQDQRIAEKTKLLQQLMQEILDEETKKLYQELTKLLQEKNKESEIKDILDKLKNKEQNIEKELDRALELFKQLKFDSKLSDITSKLKELADKQEKLSEKTQQEKNTDTETLQKEQNELNQAFEEVKKDLSELKDINEELENKHDLENTENQEKAIQESQEKSSESLSKKDKKSASKEQKSASDKMRTLQQKMEKMQQDLESQSLAENMGDLRNILENLLKISFEQEELMKEFKKVNQQDPRYLTLSQRQLKIKEDTKIIEDSLYALSKRVMQIQSFIRKELEQMNTYLNESSAAIKARRADMASGKQQFAMTSINNLALLLSDVLQQMQEQMNEKQSKGSGHGSKNKKPKNKGGTSMSQLQRKLNQQIEELKKSGMSGKKLSEELSRLSRQQEQIRYMMQEQEGKDGKPKDGSSQNLLDEIKKEMEKTESDLVNKRLTQEMLQRQQEILNRMLEHEKAQREKELDNQREAETAKEKERKLPPELDKYLKEKERQVEMIKTIPPGLNPYFKRKADDYFQQINP